MDNPKVPPAFSAKQYKAWKTRVRLWQRFTDIEKDKQAFVLASTCVAQIPDIIANLLNSSDDKLSKDNGVEFLLKELDVYFGKSEQLDIFDRFVQLMNLRSHISTFRTLFDGVVSEQLDMQNVCSLLAMVNGNFSGNELALVKSVLLKDSQITKLKVDDTCNAIKTVLVDSSSGSQQPVSVKTESVFYGSNKGRKGGQKGYGSYFDNRYSYPKGKGKQNSYPHCGSYDYSSGYRFGSGKGGKRNYQSNHYQGHSGQSRKGTGKKFNVYSSESVETQKPSQSSEQL